MITPDGLLLNFHCNVRRVEMIVSFQNALHVAFENQYVRRAIPLLVSKVLIAGLTPVATSREGQ